MANHQREPTQQTLVPPEKFLAATRARVSLLCLLGGSRRPRLTNSRCENWGLIVEEASEASQGSRSSRSHRWRRIQGRSNLPDYRASPWTSSLQASSQSKLLQGSTLEERSHSIHFTVIDV
ncbi:hypothetical protein Taro_033245 [Colocasia esculenta]|uniref:Uncharacterized protein n=1 Tax=Colocasia esculenta TaxID=4460 RepID=A0A843W6E7_COLES|nr:hypothetical protein [Colocasia esculenta]